MEERLGEMKWIEKGIHRFYKSSGYDKLELKHKRFFQAYKCIIKKKEDISVCKNMCHW